MQSPEIARLNAARIDAANALHDADAHLRGLLSRWADPTDSDPTLSARITEAQAARNAAQAAADSAEHDLAAEIAAERIEHEDAARDDAEQDICRWADGAAWADHAGGGDTPLQIDLDRRRVGRIVAIRGARATVAAAEGIGGEVLRRVRRAVALWEAHAAKTAAWRAARRALRGLRPIV